MTSPQPAHRPPAGGASPLGVAGAAPAKTSRSSFYLAMRLLPPAEREAMFAIYRFCRAVDDIADDPVGSPEERQAALNGWRADLTRLYAGDVPPALAFLRPHVSRFDLALADFLAVIDGMEMDLDGPIRAPDNRTLDLYCDRVASAVGRLGVKVFGMDDEPGRALAFSLGRALQLTNILRDLDEDATLGRLYLPREALAAASIPLGDLRSILQHSAIDQACRLVAETARRHYHDAWAIMNARPRGLMRAPRLMAAVYGAILTAMERQGWTAPRERVRLGRLHLFWLLLRYGRRR